MSELSRDRVIDRICTRFEQAWKAGERPRIEEYLIEGEGRDGLLVELLALEVFHRRRLGESPTTAEYVTQYPNLAANDLAEIFAQPATIDFPEQPLGETSPLPGMPSIPGYKILSEIARGGMGVVYCARQAGLNRTVAIKMILPGQLVTDEAVQRFRSEARNVARLNHEHIVPIYEVGEHQGQPFFTMKLIEGGSLDKRLPEYLRDPRHGPAAGPRGAGGPSRSPARSHPPGLEAVEHPRRSRGATARHGLRPGQAAGSEH